MNKAFLAPSILSADFSKLGEQVKQLNLAGVDLIHFDIMDNHYVPNLTIGPLVLKSLKRYIETEKLNLAIDVHIMASPVDDLIKQCIDKGADYISIHPEATQHLDRSLNLIKQANIYAGLALNPSTNLNVLKYSLDLLDMILIMGVNPGFAAQKFIPKTLEKIAETRKIIDSAKSSARLEVDGGVNLANIEQIKQAGADTFVVGNAIFTREKRESENSFSEIVESFKNKIA